MSEMKKKYCKECGSETNHIRPSETFMCVGCGKLRHLSSPIEDELQQRITELEAENAALRERVRWIPVSERLPELKTYASREDIICPEDYTIVITVDDKGYVSPAYFSYDGMFLDDYEMPAEPMVYGKTLFFSECLDYSSEIINNVTHWMPLPQPPEAE